MVGQQPLAGWGPRPEQGCRLSSSAVRPSACPQIECPQHERCCSLHGHPTDPSPLLPGHSPSQAVKWRLESLFIYQRRRFANGPPTPTCSGSYLSLKLFFVQSHINPPRLCGNLVFARKVNSSLAHRVILLT